MRSRRVDFAEVNRDQENCFLIDAGLRENFATRSRDKTLAPKLNAIAADRALEADPIYRGHEAAVRDRVALVTDLLGAVLVRTVFLFLLRVPANRRRIK